MNTKGNLELILGPMFAGKTTELIRIIRRYCISNNKCILVKYHGDVRYNKESETVCTIHTHDDYTNLPKEVIVKDSSNINITELLEYDVIGFDECQFIENIKELISELIINDKRVICSGLSADFKLNMFKNIIDLIPISNSIYLLSAICIYCNKDANCSYRHINLPKDDENCSILIGGKEKYHPVCFSCYNNKEKIIEK